MNINCDVIVLAWNQLEITKKFIKSFSENTIIPSRLIIIDNGSSDGTRKYLTSLKDTQNCKFKIVLNKENKGFVEGMNQGIELSDAAYICLANNDLIFSQGWLAEMISLFKNNKQIGLLNPNSNNLGVEVPENEAVASFSKILRKKNEGKFVELPFCIGFCLVTKREVIKEVGGLSEEFKPMFFEDTDYSLKVANAGYSIGVAKGAYVWHKEHESLKQLSNSKKENIFSKSRNIFEKKWGKILRVAWIIDNQRYLNKCLSRAIDLARSGNFVWILVKDADIDENIFLDNGYLIHSGVKFIKYKNKLHLIWLILKKKKRYYLLISGSKFNRFFFSKFGYKVLSNPVKEEIKKIKYS